MVGLDHVDKPADMVWWAEFHNGVAAGLRIVPGNTRVSKPSSSVAVLLGRYSVLLQVSL